MALQAVKQFRHREIAAFLKAVKSNPTPTPAAAIAAGAKAAASSAPQATTPTPTPTPTAAVEVATPTLKVPNPFLARKNPDTGRWAPAKYSLRRQADLVKQARASGLVHLLPPGPKLSLKELADAMEARQGGVAAEVAKAKSGKTKAKENLWLKEVVWEGEVKEKKVAGADIGNRLYAGKWRMFKGHKWERTREARLKKREFLMKNMKTRIERFKGTYRRRRPSPLSRPKTTGRSKLPF